LGKWSLSTTNKHLWLAFFGLAFLVLAIYSNTFHAAWQFDDKPNILNNTYLHLKDLDSDSLLQTFFTNPKDPSKTGNRLYRPIPCLTFALNWYFAGENVTGYHVVNLVIHYLTAFFLFLTILNLFQAPHLKNKFDQNAYLTALLAAVMWAVHPIQTQAVTYGVQRMTSLATLFYVLGMLFYIKCRLCRSSLMRILLLLGCGLAMVFAIGSKENTATLPAALFLIEVMFFQDISSLRNKRVFFWGAIAGGILLILVSVWLFVPADPFSFVRGYHFRPFSLAERMLTEPRIVLFYLSLIFYPNPGRFSIEHDVTISTSLFQPWTTLPAILLTAALIGIGFSQIRKRPLIALAILFFYLNHIIESTVIPLELVFEHRNYLPSLFLFLPIAEGFLKLLRHDTVKNTAMRGALLAGLAVLIIALGLGTYMRNRLWASEISLWQDAMHKAPNSARPLTNLAWQMVYGPNASPSKYDTALKLYEKALLLKKPRSFSEPVIMDNMAGIYFRIGQHEKAIDLLEKALAISPNYAKGRYDLIQILITLDSWDAAAGHADVLLSKHPDHEGYLNTKGLISLYRKKYEEAIACFQKSMSVAPFFKTTWIGLGVAYSLNGNYAIAENILRRAHQIPPKDMMALLGLIENSRRAGDILRAKEYADMLLNIYDKAAIKDQLHQLSNNRLLPPLSPEFISQIIESRLQENS
jgi:tetratricopeptide (TPR) repeat protein